MDLSNLTSFLAVAEELHFSRAASRLHLSQSALSKQVQQLEGELDVRLFVRDRRSVRLTPEGASLLDRARAVIAAADDVRDFAAQLRRGAAGRLRVGFAPSAPHAVLPSVLRVFRRKYPHVEIDLVEMSSGRQVPALRRGALDVGILRPPHIRPSDLFWHDILREPFVAAVPSDSPLRRQRRLTLRHLAATPIVLVARLAAPDVYDDLLECFHQAGFAPQVREATQVHTALALVAAGAGVSLLPESATRVGMTDVVVRPIAHALVTVFAVACAKENTSPTLDAFIQVVKTVSPK